MVCNYKKTTIISVFILLFATMWMNIGLADAAQWDDSKSGNGTRGSAIEFFLFLNNN